MNLPTRNVVLRGKLAFFAFCLAVQLPSASATVYYVSSSQGNDANAGTASSAPWKSLNKIYLKSISSSKFQPGDSILLKAGDTFEGLLQLYNSGTNGAPVYVGKYGTGANPILYGDNPSAVWSAVSGHPGVYSAVPATGNQIARVADISGNQYTKIASQGTNTLDAWLNTLVAGSWACTPSLVYVRTLSGSAPPQMHLFQYSAIQVSANYATIENLDVRNALQGIVIMGVKGCTIKNNSVQDTCNIGIYCNVGTSYAEVASNSVTRSGWTTVLLSRGGNNWVHHNTISYATNNVLGLAINGAELCGIGLQQGTNNLVEFNTLSNITQTCVDYWLEVNSVVRNNFGVNAAGPASPDGTGLSVYNNIFKLIPQNGGNANGFSSGYHYDPLKSPAPASGKNLIYNNIVYGFTGYGLFFGTNYSNVVYRNNIFVTSSTDAILAMVWPGVDMDYNLYYCTGGLPRQWTWNNVAQTTFSAFQTASGQEFHGRYANPQFVSDNPLTAADFKLKSTSPCIDVGEDLKNAGLLQASQPYKDYLGTLIPVRIPDIGPYERTLDPASGLHAQ